MSPDSAWKALRKWLDLYQDSMIKLRTDAETGGDLRLRDLRSGREMAAREMREHMAEIEARP